MSAAAMDWCPDSGEPAAAARDTCLAATLFDDIQLAASSSDEHQTVPSAWRERFAARAHEPSVYNGLFRACTAGRVWTLTSARTAHLRRLPPAHGEALEPWRRQLAAVKDALLVRGPLPTTLTIACPGQPAAGAYDLIVSVLQGSCSGITEMSLVPANAQFTHNLYAASDSAPVTAFLASLGPALPNTTTLTISVACEVPAPGPTAFPRLSKVVVPATLPNHGAARLYGSLSRALGHITCLEVLSSYPSWSSLFPHGTKSTSLTTLKTNTFLNPRMMQCVLQCLPNLRELTVRSIDSSPFHLHEDWEWPLQKLTVQGPLDIDRLVSLPQSTTGRLQICAPRETLRIPMGEEGLSAELRARLSQWCLDVDTVALYPGSIVQAAYQPTALRSALIQLGDVQAPSVVIELGSWQLTPHLFQMVISTLTLIPHIRFDGFSNGLPLTDSTLRQLTQAGPNLRSFAVNTLSLTSDQQSNTDWPWAALTIDSVDVISMLKMPHPGGYSGVEGDGGSGPVVRCKTLDFTRVTQKTAESLRDRLRHLTWEPCGRQDPYPRCLSLTIDASNESDALAQLGLAGSLKWLQTDKYTHTHITLSVPTTQDVMRALRGLSQSYSIDMLRCTFPLHPGAYTQLYACLPHTDEWKLNLDPHCEELACMAQGVNAHRRGTGVVPLMVALTEPLMGFGWTQKEMGQGVLLVPLDN